MRALEVPANAGTGHRSRPARRGARRHRGQGVPGRHELLEPARRAHARRGEARARADARPPRRSRSSRTTSTGTCTSTARARAPPARSTGSGLVMLCGVVLEDARAGVPRRVRGARAATGTRSSASSSRRRSRRRRSPQMAVADFLENGGYERHLRRLRRALAEQVAAGERGDRRALPGRARASRARGAGSCSWVEMPPGQERPRAARPRARARG